MKYLLILSLSFFTNFAIADNESGFYLGAGSAATINDDCGDFCDSDGYAFEAGHYFNKIVGIEVKVAKTEFDADPDFEMEMSYIGANIGHTFNTSWVRFYGKVGYLRAKEIDTYFNESVSDSNLALGIGVTFTPVAHQSGFYIKVESMASEFLSDNVGFAHIGIGYQF